MSLSLVVVGLGLSVGVFRPSCDVVSRLVTTSESFAPKARLLSPRRPTGRERQPPVLFKHKKAPFLLFKTRSCWPWPGIQLIGVSFGLRVWGSEFRVEGFTPGLALGSRVLHPSDAPREAFLCAGECDVCLGFGQEVAGAAGEPVSSSKKTTANRASLNSNLHDHDDCFLQCYCVFHYCGCDDCSVLLLIPFLQQKPNPTPQAQLARLFSRVAAAQSLRCPPSVKECW